MGKRKKRRERKEFHAELERETRELEITKKIPAWYILIPMLLIVFVLSFLCIAISAINGKTKDILAEQKNFVSFQPGDVVENYDQNLK